MQLTRNIHLIQIDFEISISPEKKIPRFVNCIILLADTITLIDTGVKGSEIIIADYLKGLSRDISEVETVILSHAHPDHIGSAAKIKELSGCKVLAHNLEKEWIENIDLQNNQRPVPEFYNLVDTPVVVDECVANNQTMNIADGLTLQFIEAPGHSKGSLNILFKEDNILFTADSIPLKNDIPNYDNFIDLMKSLEAIKKQHNITILLTSWTPPIKDNVQQKTLIAEGEEYLKTIDSAVKECYANANTEDLNSCKQTIVKLGLPPFLTNPLVDKAFRSHLVQ